MSSNSNNNNAELSGALSTLNIDESNNNEEKGATSNNTDINTVAILCANCGKEGGDSMNSCNKCDLVVYCNAACKKKHKSKHKKKCEKRAAELFDEALFEESTPPEDCPICMLPPPLYDNHTGTTFHPCCGKEICDGCEYAMRVTGDMELCPFYKTPPANSDKEEVERLKKLMEKGNADAFHHLAGLYGQGTMGMPPDMAKANELFLKAGELGCAGAYFNLGIMYSNGRGVAIDKKKAKHYYELAAINGNVDARAKLGATEYNGGNHQRALKHFQIAASAGYEKSLDMVKGGFMDGFVTREEYANTLRAYQKSQDETKSDSREKARAFLEMHV